MAGSSNRAQQHDAPPSAEVVANACVHAGSSSKMVSVKASSSGTNQNSTAPSAKEGTSTDEH